MEIQPENTAPSNGVAEVKPAVTAPAGCGNTGSCGTSSCNKLNVYDWLTGMQLPPGQEPFDVVEIRFKGSRKEFFRNKERLELHAGDVVAVEAAPGHDIGVVSLTGELVRFQMKKKKEAIDSPDIKAVYRKAKPADVEKWKQVRGLEQPTMLRARVIARDLGLVMKISDVEFQGDGKKATFYYTAEDRVDFRELIKRYAAEFRVRVEMRQIGMRQEASRLGGIGSCGRELCCSTWLTDFRTVSTSAARYQNLALNPQKLAGQCGKLKCCLNYELDSYMDALKGFPDIDLVLETAKGRATHRKTDLFKRMMWYSYGGATFSRSRKDSEDVEGLQEPDSPDNWVALPVERVKQILELNRKGTRPDDLQEAAVLLREKEKKAAEPDFKDVVGQDSLTRMDRKKPGGGQQRRKKRRKPGRPGGGRNNRNEK